MREQAAVSGSLFRYVIKHTLSGALGGLVLGEKLKDDLNLFVPDERLFILPNAIPDVKLAQHTTAQKADGPVQVLFLSNLIPSKGPMEFVKMAAAVYKLNNNVRFVLAGNYRESAFFQEINECIEQMGIREVITIPGAVYGADKEKLFRESDIFVFPTYYNRETFGLVNLEAMQCGIPVISTSEGAIPEVVQDGVNGFIIDPHDIPQMADRVLMLINDKKFRKAMGKAGRQRYEQLYTINAYEKRLEESISFFLTLRQTSRNNVALKGVY
jgi:glycosyltransferase involved in cell wall biosynthesis